MKLKKYSHYKDSHIDWIGEIPEGWETRRLKINFQYKKGKIPKELFEEKIDDNYYPYLSMDFLRGKEDNALFTSKKYGGIKVNNNDLLLLWDGSNAGEFVIGKEGFLSSTMVKFDLFNIDINYSYYLTSSFESVLRDLTIGMGIPHVNGSDLNNIKIPFIPLQTQKRISSFLDSKTLQIENLIEKDKKLIELLKERRISLINKAVTKGLDDSVKMKDSGVEWIGEIPENWEVRKLKNVAVVIMGQSPDGNSVNDDGNGIPFFQGKAEFGNINPIIKNYTIKPTKIVKSNDILLSVRAPVGAINIANIKCCIGRGLSGIRYNNYNYLYYLLKVTKSEFDIYSSGSTFDAISTDNLKSILLPFTPNTQEQQKIVEFLDKETVKIDNHIKKVEKRIELYKEYKKSLIYNVVTGKVEV